MATRTSRAAAAHALFGGPKRKVTKRFLKDENVGYNGLAVKVVKYGKDMTVIVGSGVPQQAVPTRLIEDISSPEWNRRWDKQFWGAEGRPLSNPKKRNPSIAKGTRVTVRVGNPWPEDASKIAVTGKVVRVRGGMATVDVERSRANPSGHPNEDVALVEVPVATLGPVKNPIKAKPGRKHTVQLYRVTGTDMYDRPTNDSYYSKAVADYRVAYENADRPGYDRGSLKLSGGVPKGGRPAVSPRFASKAKKRKNPADKPWALAKRSGWDDLVVSMHESREAAEAALAKKTRYRPGAGDTPQSVGYMIVKTGKGTPGKGYYDVITLDRQKMLRLRT